jgi:broad specificity phosphatase PhoE
MGGISLFSFIKAACTKRCIQRHWAKLDGDEQITWADAELTTLGEKQASDAATFWADAFEHAKVPLPGKFYSSPLRRCLSTLQLTFADLLLSLGRPFKPDIKELLRERHGVHTCDRRSTRTWIEKTYPEFLIEDDFTEQDVLWKPNARETMDEHVKRTTELLDDIFLNENSESISLTTHSGAIMALFRATGYQEIPVKAGAIFPLLVKAEIVEQG